MQMTIEQQLENLKNSILAQQKETQNEALKLVTIKEAAQIVKASEGTVRRWIKNGLIRTRNFGRKYLICIDDLIVK